MLMYNFQIITDIHMNVYLGFIMNIDQPFPPPTAWKKSEILAR